MRFDGIKRWQSVTLGLALTSIYSAAPLHAQASEGQGAGETAEGVVAEIYDLVSFAAGERPDWDKVRALFIPEAVIVLRTSREATTVFSVDGFVDDFVSFIEQTPAGEQGFTERILNTKAMVFGEMAHVLVLYEAHITGSPRAPSQGVDSFSLIKQNGVWRIVAITNELPAEGRPIPLELRSE
jgi:hypothetical protein